MNERILVAGINKIDPCRFTKTTGSMTNILDTLNKPNGGLWGSTYTPDATYPSDWIRWVKEEDYKVNRYNHGISFTLSNDATICEIDSAETYREIIKPYAVEIRRSSSPIFHNTLVLDWNKISKKYDVFHLTEYAFWSMRLPIDDRLKTDMGYLPNFYSYDCETWIIFNLECIDHESILRHRFDL